VDRKKKCGRIRAQLAKKKIWRGERGVIGKDIETSRGKDLVAVFLLLEKDIKTNLTSRGGKEIEERKVKRIVLK